MMHQPLTLSRVDRSMFVCVQDVKRLPGDRVRVKLANLSDPECLDVTCTISAERARELGLDKKG